MIARITGLLEAIEGGSALVRVGEGLTYQVLVPAYTAARLGASVGRTVTLHTFHFIESQGQGMTMMPRLAGFTAAQDRRFYELFTTVKGIGNKRALRAMALETGQIAGAIADRDLALLQTLPEIGRRTAETIVATLSGKVDGFVAAASAAAAGAEAGPGATAAGAGSAGGLTRAAMEVLLRLGENRNEALAWIDQVLRDQKDHPRDVQDLIQRVYRIKAGG
jgi:Holliday junction DNA helicase RuvA